MFESKIEAIKKQYGIHSFEDWRQVTPLQIVSVPNVGTVTLDHIRLYLAQHDCTLKGDMTPGFWRKNLQRMRIGSNLADTDRNDVCPFTVLVDSMEQLPFSFTNIKADADLGNRPLFVPVKRKALGFTDQRYYQPMGDYSIEGHEGNIHLERKSIQDCQSTILGYGGRRERFEKELEVLAGLPVAAVIVEGTLDQVVLTVQSHGEREVKAVRKNLYRSIISLQLNYRVPWFFCASKPMAEDTAFRIMMRYFKQEKKINKQIAKQG